MIDQSKIRNFCIIAHIDHGKSTLADRIIEMTGTLTEREMQSQVLDNMELERERGITIKSQAVRIVYKASDGEEYIFNLIDTPGHVDFNYEVSRSLAACDGAILVVDAAQGIEAQTLANVYLALDHDLDVLPVINKIDLPSAEPDRVVNEIEDVIGIEAHDAPRISAKTGLNVEEVLEQIVTKIPAPNGDVDAPLKALIFDSIYDAYKGVIVFCRVLDGRVKKGTQIRMMATGFTTEVVEVGYFGAGQFIPCDELTAGMVGYITASIKNLGDTRVGDTVTDNERPCAEALPGYKKVQPMVYCGLYPADGAKYGDLRDALEKLAVKRCFPVLRTRDICGTGLWFPLWFPWSSSSGDHSGASGERVQSGSGNDSTGCYLQGLQDKRRYDRTDQPIQSPGSVRDRIHGRADGKCRDHGNNRVYRRNHGSLSGTPWPVHRNGIYGRDESTSEIQTASE